MESHYYYFTEDGYNVASAYEITHFFDENIKYHTHELIVNARAMYVIGFEREIGNYFALAICNRLKTFKQANDILTPSRRTLAEADIVRILILDKQAHGAYEAGDTHAVDSYLNELDELVKTFLP